MYVVMDIEFAKRVLPPLSRLLKAIATGDLNPFVFAESDHPFITTDPGDGIGRRCIRKSALDAHFKKMWQITEDLGSHSHLPHLCDSAFVQHSNALNFDLLPKPS